MIKSLEGGRGIAALIVALYHLNIGTAQFSVIRNGYLLVDLFFVLSAFVLCASYSNRLNTPRDVRSFSIRRFGRLFPLLIFSTVIFLLAANAMVLGKRLVAALGYTSMLNNPGALDYVVPSMAEILATVTLTHSMGLFDRLILNTPSWSISTESYTYFAFADICLMLHGRGRLAAFAVLCIGGLIVSVWASVAAYNCLQQKGCLSLTYDFGFARTLYSFFLGALVYHASRTLRINPAPLQWIAVAARALLFWLVDAFPAVAFSFPLAFALVLVSISSDEGWLAAILQCAPFQQLGERSYSIYLMHMPLLLFFENFAKRVNGPVPSTMVLLSYIAVLIVVSGWTYRYIEDPFRAIFNRLAVGSRRLGTRAIN